jgi:hypothetical protein
MPAQRETFARRTARHATDWALVALSLLVAQTGCHSWPFGKQERTSLITPSMRVAAIREMAPRSESADSAERLELCQQLASQIMTEPDPIVRRAIQETIAEIDHPLALDVLKAGLADDDREVRLTCCRMLAKRGDSSAAGVLAAAARNDRDIDVRLEAVSALGTLKTDDSVRALAGALKDRDPAMQYAAVEAMRAATGKDLGNDVEAWRQYAATLESSGAATSVAANPAETQSTTR